MSEQKYRTDDFTPEERAELRRSLDGDRKVRWLMSALKVVAIWVASVVAAVYAMLQILRDSIKALGSG